METIKTYSFPRAGLLGNPSDGYFGKTVSFAFSDFGVELTLTESARLCFVPGEVDDATFASRDDLVRDLRLYGYYGGIRLLKAVSKRFFEYCIKHDIALPKRNFTASYKINIPRLVGLSGSSAICTAMLKALCRFYEVPILVGAPSCSCRKEENLHSPTPNSNSSIGIPMEVLPTICLEAEKEELRINCGFQDRVIQIYNGLVFMDFNKSFVEAHNHGIYERLDPSILVGAPSCICSEDLNLHSPTPTLNSNLIHLYIAYDAQRAEESGEAHKEVKRLFEAKNSDVLAAMSEFADIAQRGRDLLVGVSSCSCRKDINLHSPTPTSNSNSKLAELVNANFDLRDRIFNVAEENRRMVMTARSVGASAKFAGSGGAIVGTYEDDAQFAALVHALGAIGCKTFRPTIATSDETPEIRSAVANWRNS